MKIWFYKLNIIFSSLIVMNLFAPVLAMTGANRASASAGQAAIAFVVPNDVTGDEIHLIDPDGTNNRKIWSTNMPRQTSQSLVNELTWKPDSSEISFWSSFQEACSIYNGDIYAIKPTGAGLRRVSAPPDCGGYRDLPKGTVNVNVVNSTLDMGTFVVYVEGAPGPKEVTLASGSGKIVTFTDVIDYGDGVGQWAVAIYGYSRFRSQYAYADVKAGQTVSTKGPLYTDFESEHWGFNSPAYSPDGTQTAYFSGWGTLYVAPTGHTTPGGVGVSLLGSGVTVPGYPSGLQWGRGAYSNQLLYHTFDWNNIGEAIYLANANSGNMGAELLLLNSNWTGTGVNGLVWLPDGSGFLYSTMLEEYLTTNMHGNIYEYNFNTKASTQLTNFDYGYPLNITISPLGDKVIFEYMATDSYWDNPQPIDLWSMDRDGSNARLFLKDAQSPAWSPGSLPQYKYLYIPFVNR